MIYHNYSPYYYGSFPKQNKKILNSNNIYNSTSYSNANINNSYSASLNNPNNYYKKAYNYVDTSSSAKPYNKITPYNAQKNNYYNFNFSQSQSTKENDTEISKQKKIPPKSNNDVIFEIFGIKLYFDDILLICLIFFLYNEGVQDQYLFIALILLLLS